MKKFLITLSILSFLSAVAIISPWKAIGDKILGVVGLSVSSPVSISVNSKEGNLRVFINDKEEGTTPLELNNLSPGSYKVKLVKDTNTPDFYTEFERAFDIEEGTQVVINWELGPSNEFSSGEIYFFKRNLDEQSDESTVSIIPHPDNASIYFDGAKQSGPPFVLDGIKEGRHKAKVEQDHFIDTEIDIQTKEGYDLFLEIRLFPLPVDIELE